MEINAKLTVLQWSRGGLAVVSLGSLRFCCGFAVVSLDSQTNENPYKSMEIHGSLWNLLKIHANPWKSIEIFGN